MKWKRLLLPLAVGGGFAAFNVIAIYFINLILNPVLVAISTVVFYFLIPGLLLGLLAGRNLHDPSILAIAVPGNFLFYFGVTYFVMRWRKPKVKPGQMQ